VVGAVPTFREVAKPLVYGSVVDLLAGVLSALAEAATTAVTLSVDLAFSVDNSFLALRLLGAGSDLTGSARGGEPGTKTVLSTGSETAATGATFGATTGTVLFNFAEPVSSNFIGSPFLVSFPSFLVSFPSFLSESFPSFLSGTATAFGVSFLASAALLFESSSAVTSLSA